MPSDASCVATLGAAVATTLYPDETNPYTLYPNRVLRPTSEAQSNKMSVDALIFLYSFFTFAQRRGLYIQNNPKQMTRHSDSDILTALNRSPEEGFVVLLEQFQEPIYWYIRRLVVGHHDSEDVTQEVFVRIFRGLPHFKGGSSLTTWVYRIATNEALRWLKRNRSRGGEFLQACKVAGRPQEPHINFEDMEAVVLQRAITSLPPKQRVVFNLCYYDELSYEQVATIVGGRPSAAKANFHLAKKSIREYLLSQLDE